MVMSSLKKKNRETESLFYTVIFVSRSFCDRADLTWISLYIRVSFLSVYTFRVVLNMYITMKHTNKSVGFSRTIGIASIDNTLMRKKLKSIRTDGDKCDHYS